MDIEKKIEIVKRKPIVETITDSDLLHLFQTNPHPTHYIGFEISGYVHLGSGLITALKIKDFLEVGIKPLIWLADYHTWINRKLGGDLKKIQEIARGYFKSAFNSLGLSDDKVEYQLASENYDSDYWKLVLDISNKTTLDRMTRCLTIMGRTSKEKLFSSSLIYPAMQVADIFKLDVDIAHAGLDQRKAHILAREIGEKFKRKPFAILHHSLLSGLLGPKRMGFEEDEKADIQISSKMSKSNPSSCIYLHDSPEQIKNKINAAYCPPKEIEANPIIDICNLIILRTEKDSLTIQRPSKYGGEVTYTSAEELILDYKKGRLHPADLKEAVSEYLIKALAPSREYFEKNKHLLKFHNINL
ncbi:MAG: tyrosine--tRNA ligase [Candidatus Anstonellales archaeon]